MSSHKEKDMPEQPVFISFVGGDEETEQFYRAVVERLQIAHEPDACVDLGDPFGGWENLPEDMPFLDFQFHVLSRWVEFRKYLSHLRNYFRSSGASEILIVRRFGCDLIADSAAALAGPHSQVSWNTILSMHRRLVRDYITNAGITPPLYLVREPVSAECENVLAHYFYKDSGQRYKRIESMEMPLQVDFAADLIARERAKRRLGAHLGQAA